MFPCTHASDINCIVVLITYIDYERLSDLEDNENEVIWVKLKPKRLPRYFSCIILANVDNLAMRDYIVNCIDIMIRKHPDCGGVIIAGDFNQLRDNFFKSHYGFVQLVNKPTRNMAILDTILTNMESVG